MDQVSNEQTNPTPQTTIPQKRTRKPLFAVAAILVLAVLAIAAIFIFRNFHNPIAGYWTATTAVQNGDVTPLPAESGSYIKIDQDYSFTLGVDEDFTINGTLKPCDGSLEQSDMGTPYILTFGNGETHLLRHKGNELYIVIEDILIIFQK